MAATNMFEPSWIVTGLIEDRLLDPKQLKTARFKLIPIFCETPNSPIFFNQTINSSPSQTSMAATNMSEPGWILIGFIEDRLGDLKHFNPARLKPICSRHRSLRWRSFFCLNNDYKEVWRPIKNGNGLEQGWIELFCVLETILNKTHWDYFAD